MDKTTLFAHRLSLIALIALCLNESVCAQRFISPYEIPMGRSCIIVNRDSSTITGAIASFTMGRGGIKKLTLQDSLNGGRIHVELRDVSFILIRNSKFNKILNSLKRFESIKKIKNTDFKDYVNQDFIVFERIGPIKEKYYAGQVLNPGFSSKIKIFYAPLARTTTGIGFLTGGMNRAYFVAKDDRVIKIRRGNYKRNYKDLYSNCQALEKKYKGKKGIKFIEEHVYAYENECK